jgi:peptidoglycan/xylan/chitin deacetylase (PgdA/CDA1 family)
MADVRKAEIQSLTNAEPGAILRVMKTSGDRHMTSRHRRIAFALAILATACAAGGLFYILAPGTAGASAAVIYRLPTKDRTVALTFDDGPDLRYTPGILRILSQENIAATFFLIGDKVQKVGKSIDYGTQLIGYHTYDHAQMKKLSAAQQITDFEEGAKTFPRTYDTGGGFWRAPRGEADPATIAWVNRRGKYVLWDLVYDKVIKNPDGSIRPSAERVNLFLSRVKPGDIVLMHDGNNDGFYLTEDLPNIIHGLREAGYSFVSLETLARKNN